MTEKEINIERHKELMDKIHETYIQKNNAYGNSFDESLDEFGIVSAMTRMSDKWNRLKSLVNNPDIPTGDESIMDTLLDLSNYCAMTYMWLDRHGMQKNPCSGTLKDFEKEQGISNDNPIPLPKGLSDEEIKQFLKCVAESLLWGEVGHHKKKKYSYSDYYNARSCRLF